MLVYKITCKLNNMGYVGKTTRPLEVRIAEHLRGNIRTSYIDRSIKEHGWENFTVEVLAVCETIDELNECEKKKILEHNTKSPNGYNLTDGGEGIPGYKAPPELSARLSAQRKGRKITPEQAAKISATMTGREFTDEHKANISAAKLGHAVPDEVRAKLAIANTGKKDSAETRAKKSASAAKKRAVRCVETGKIFTSMKIAMAWAKISRHVLRKACLNENYIAGGYHWQYVD